MTDLIERLGRTPEYIDTDKDQRIVDMCDEAVNEILRLRNRVWELEDKLHAARVGACEVGDEKDALIRELTKLLDEKLAARDAAWGRAIEWWWWNSGRWEGDSKDFHAAIRERLEAEKGD